MYYVSMYVYVQGMYAVYADVNNMGLTNTSSPTTLHPLILAIWPTIEPTAPAAPLTTTVSPSFGKHTSMKHNWAVALCGRNLILNNTTYVHMVSW